LGRAYAEHFQALLQHAAAARSFINTVLMGTIGGGIAVACYTALVFTRHSPRVGLQLKREWSL